MSCSSDSEDDNLKKVLEAADTTLLNNSLFNTPIVDSLCNENLKSERYLNTEESSSIDFVPSETVQRVMAKKLSLLVEKQIEFIKTSNLCKEQTKKKTKSRVRLLYDFDCYVKSFEDFAYEDLGPRRKTHLKRRDVDNLNLNEETKIQTAAIDGEFVLSRKETDSWSDRSKGKVYSYKLGKGINKVYHFIEPENEFTKTRRKNQWNESKIKKTKFSTEIK